LLDYFQIAKGSFLIGKKDIAVIGELSQSWQKCKFAKNEY
jgi:hypothetical protein